MLKEIPDDPRKTKSKNFEVDGGIPFALRYYLKRKVLFKAKDSDRWGGNGFLQS